MIYKTNPQNQNRELGKVSWYRDYDEAIQVSKETNKPILLFFQEVPGCATCVNFGRDVLSHPLMVEAIENEFVPLAIYNNVRGKDAEILNRYNEPSWNNPVAHFIDSNGHDIIPKLANNYEPLSMLNKMIQTLNKLKRKIPPYILLLEKDLKIKYGRTQTAVYETPCFWSGETAFAQNEAVYSTLAGFVGHSEVVKLEYDDKKVSRKELDQYAQEQGFFSINDNEKFRIDKDPQYYLKNSNFRFLPLSDAQKTAINLALPYKQNPEQYLSPKQKEWLQNPELTHKLKTNFYEQDIISGWEQVKKILQ